MKFYLTAFAVIFSFCVFSDTHLLASQAIKSSEIELDVNDLSNVLDKFDAAWGNGSDAHPLASRAIKGPKVELDVTDLKNALDRFDSAWDKGNEAEIEKAKKRLLEIGLESSQPIYKQLKKANLVKEVKVTSFVPNGDTIFYAFPYKEKKKIYSVIVRLTLETENKKTKVGSLQFYRLSLPEALLTQMGRHNWAARQALMKRDLKAFEKARVVVSEKSKTIVQSLEDQFKGFTIQSKIAFESNGPSLRFSVADKKKNQFGILFLLNYSSSDDKALGFSLTPYPINPGQ